MKYDESERSTKPDSISTESDFCNGYVVKRIHNYTIW